MQHVQQQELPERISWARALIFGVGFFFIAAILIGQLPGYLYLQMTAASLAGLEQGSLGLAVAFLGTFAVIQAIVMLFDPKPVVRPIIFTGLGVAFAVVGLAIAILTSITGCAPNQQTCNQFFPTDATVWNPVLGGKVLWFQPNAVDFVMIGIALLGIGLAWIFYSQLAIREQRNPDLRDLGTTPAIRWMIVGSSILLVLFIIAYTYVNDAGFAQQLFPQNPFFGLKLIDLIASIILGASIFLALGALLLRLHYLMRPMRKKAMPALYAVGALGLAQTGAILLLVWFVLYPLVAWMHTWTFIGLNDYFLICARKTVIPASCSFSPQAGYLIDAIVTTNFFALMLAAVWVWKSNRTLVVIASIITIAAIAAATLLVHTAPGQLLFAMMLCAAMLILAVIWTSVARREFAIVGENNLGCLGQWLVVGTCLLIYLAAFAFFSIPLFTETEPNIPFVSGLAVPPPPPAPNQPPPIPAVDAVVMLFVLGILAAIQFYFLTRNRYKV